MRCIIDSSHYDLVLTSYIFTPFDMYCNRFYFIYHLKLKHLTSKIIQMLLSITNPINGLNKLLWNKLCRLGLIHLRATCFTLCDIFVRWFYTGSLKLGFQLYKLKFRQLICSLDNPLRLSELTSVCSLPPLPVFSWRPPNETGPGSC